MPPQPDTRPNLPQSSTTLVSWFERDRSHVGLENTHTGQTIVEWWDEEATAAIEDGTLDRGDLHASAYAHAEEVGALPPAMTMRVEAYRGGVERKETYLGAFLYPADGTNGPRQIYAGMDDTGHVTTGLSEHRTERLLPVGKMHEGDVDYFVNELAEEAERRGHVFEKVDLSELLCTLKAAADREVDASLTATDEDAEPEDEIALDAGRSM